MNCSLNTLTLRVLSTLLCTSALAACGGGGGTTNPDTASVQAALVVAKSSTTSLVPAAIKPVTATSTDPTTPGTPVVVISSPGSGAASSATPTPPTVAPGATLAVITDVRLQNTGTMALTSVPVTFGQIFAVGDMKPTDVLVGRLEDNTLVALQVDIKAKHADGSVRHAIISAIVPSLAASATRTMSLAKNAAPTTSATMLPATLLAAGFTASTSATINGVKYSASADQLLKAGAKATWLTGPVANEWLVSAPLTTAAGVAHPHLSARFAIRYFSSVKKAKVDVTIENDWAFEPGPQNFAYDAEVVVGGKSVFTQAGLTHLTHARWRKTFWWGGEVPAINAMLNTKYLIATKAVANYDQTIGVSPTMLANVAANYAKSANGPMGNGLWYAYMPTTGAHEDIGLLPSWNTAYLLTMDKGARDAMLGTSDLAGSFSAHYRDKNTDRPVSLKNYPYMTIVGNYGDTYNPTTKLMEAFPGCAGDCSSPYVHDVAHQPSMAYLPYLVTGDYYYLEELQFWAMYDVFSSNPNYRGNVQGVVQSEQVRGQAWALRTLADAAYITPDADMLKADFIYFMDANMSWYNLIYSNSSTANNLGAIVNGAAYSYAGNTAIAPWQDDFFTSAIGHAADLGFTKAATLLSWKSKFPVGRMTAPGVCWYDAAIYDLVIRPKDGAAVFSTFAEAETATRGAAFMHLACGGAPMAAIIGAAKLNDMGQLSDYYMGYPSNMQPALAYSVDSGNPSAKAAWALFTSRTVKPDYSMGPQFSIVPR